MYAYSTKIYFHSEAHWLYLGIYFILIPRDTMSVALKHLLGRKKIPHDYFYSIMRNIDVTNEIIYQICYTYIKYIFGGLYYSSLNKQAIYLNIKTMQELMN